MPDDPANSGGYFGHYRWSGAEPASAPDPVLARPQQVSLDLLARLPVPLAITRLSDGRILFANNELARLHHTKVSQLIGQPIQELYYRPEERQRLLDRLARDGEVRDFDIQTKRLGDGAPLWVSISVDRIYFAGEPALCATVVDITARKQAEQALRESEAHFRLLAESAHDLLFRYELLPYPHLSYVSPSVTRLTGYTPEELYSDPALAAMLAHPDALRRMEPTAQPGQGLEVPLELSLRRKDGSVVWIELRNVPLYDGQGRLAAFKGIARDITERKQLEREHAVPLALATTLRLAASRAEVLKALLALCSGVVAGSIALFATREPGTGRLVLEASNTARQIQLQLDPWLREVDGISARVWATGEPYWSSQLPPGLVPANLGDITALACLPLVAQEETMGVLWLLSQAALTPDEAQLLVALANMAANALQRVVLHEQASRHAEDLERQVALRTRELAAANERLQELDRMKSKFVSDVSHELRAPVASLMLYLNLLAHRPEKQAQYMAVLHQQVARLDTLIRDILDLSRLEQQREPLRVTQIDLNVVLENVVTAHQPRAEALGLELRFTPAEGLPAVLGDPEKLVQVFTNLVVNALNYTPSGAVQVRTYLDQEQHTVCGVVQDTGVGILPEDLPHVFERFYRGKQDKMPPAPGTGLGLSIVKELVDLHGGAITVASEVGRGTTFTVDLPIQE